VRFHIFLCTIFLTACGPSSNSVPAATSSQAPTPTGLHFQFSKAPRAVTYEGEPNPCYQKFPQALAFFPDPANSKRRYFALGEGLHKVSVQEKGPAAFFWIQRKGDLTVEVLTSDQLGQCLSNRAHFAMDADGKRFRYNNERSLDFTVSVEQVGGVLRIWVEMPPDRAYGMSAWGKGD